MVDGEEEEEVRNKFLGSVEFLVIKNCILNQTKNCENASLTPARRHRMVPRDHNDGFMALYDVGSLRLLTHFLFLFLSVLGALCFFNNEW